MLMGDIHYSLVQAAGIDPRLGIGHESTTMLFPIFGRNAAMFQDLLTSWADAPSFPSAMREEELISRDDMSVFTIGPIEAAGVTEAGIEKELINVVEAGLPTVERVKVNF